MWTVSSMEQGSLFEPIRLGLASRRIETSLQRPLDAEKLMSCARSRYNTDLAVHPTRLRFERPLYPSALLVLKLCLLLFGQLTLV